MKHASLFLHVVLFFIACISFMPLQAQRQPPFNAGRVTDWIKAVRTHVAATPDSAAKAISPLAATDLSRTIDDVIALLQAQASARAQATPPALVEYHGKTFTLPALETLLGFTPDEAARGDGNRVRKRGALLHTDIALLETRLPRPPRPFGGLTFRAPDTIRIDDGQVQQAGSATISPHWALARKLMGDVTPSPAADPTVRQWYAAIAARHLRSREWALALPCLARAELVLPDDPRIHFYGGVVHEVFASPSIQSVVQMLANRRVTQLDVQSEEVELADAERHYRRALALDPAFAEARLRLGQVLTQWGRNDDAVAELGPLADTVLDQKLAYYAALFLGRAEAQRGHGEAAHAAFARALVFFPMAQTALLADSQLSRREEDSPRALAMLQRLIALPAPDQRRPDPWWAYDTIAARDADELLAGFYLPFLPERQP